MTLLEAIIAMTIMFGTVFAAINSYQMVAEGSNREATEMEVDIASASLLARAGVDIPLAVGQYQGVTPRGLVWSLKIDEERRDSDRLVLYKVTSHLTGHSLGINFDRQISTLKSGVR